MDSKLIDIRLINPFLFTGCECPLCSQEDDFGAYAILHIFCCPSWENCPHTWCSRKMADSICHAVFCEKGNTCSAHCRRLNVIFENVFHPRFLCFNNELTRARLLFFRMLVKVGRKKRIHKNHHSTGARFLKILLSEPFTFQPQIKNLFS